MSRVRLAFLLLVPALALPVCLLVWRALESVELERSVRQAAVAERVFDEMERELTRFLEQEEARPVDDYRFYSRLDQEEQPAPATRLRSPLSHPPQPGFVIAHFQLDPDGGLRTPLRPEDEARARALGDWPPPPAERAANERAVAELQARVAPFWREALARQRPASPREAPSDARLAPAATGRSEEALAREEAPAAREPAQSSAYEILQSLNVGARQREERKQKVTEAPRSQLFARPLPSFAPAPPPSEPAPAAAPSSDEALGRAGSGALREGRLADAAASVAPLRAERRPTAKASRIAPQRGDRIRIVLEPMVGQALDDGHLLLYRTVLVEGRGYRQGLLIDGRGLGVWLRDQVLAGSALAGSLQIDFEPAAAAEPLPPGAFVALHSFAEPFSALGARLAIPPLAERGSGSLILALAAVLGVVALMALLAVYRMVSVVVHFAERRNNFVAAVSHELKTPLTAIRMYAEMLRDGIVGSEGKRDEYHRTITDESERLSRLIDNVLEFSRLEKGTREVALSVGDLGDVVLEVSGKLRPHAERAGFRLEVDVEPGLPAVRFDRDALVQMLFNLIDNAMKYGAGAERREIRLQCGRLTDGRIAVSVRDFGPGVPRKHLARVFEPFFRVEQELTRSTRGSGIGLALVKELGEAMGAAVSGGNAEGGGFRVRIAFER